MTMERTDSVEPIIDPVESVICQDDEMEDEDQDDEGLEEEDDEEEDSM